MLESALLTVALSIETDLMFKLLVLSFIEWESSLLLDKSVLSSVIAILLLFKIPLFELTLSTVLLSLAQTPPIDMKNINIVDINNVFLPIEIVSPHKSLPKNFFLNVMFLIIIIIIIKKNTLIKKSVLWNLIYLKINFFISEKKIFMVVIIF